MNNYILFTNLLTYYYFALKKTTLLSINREDWIVVAIEYLALINRQETLFLSYIHRICSIM